MPISIEADPTLPQGYLKVNGVTAATVTSTGLTTASLQNAAVTPAKLSQPYTLATAQNSTSGTNVDFTGIPSWAKRITVMFNGVSLSGSANMLIQLGSGSFVTTGYVGSSNFLYGGASSGLSGSTSGVVIYMNATANILTGSINFSLMTGNVWLASGVGVYDNNGSQMFTAGKVTLSGALDRLRVTNTGTDNFDAGTINISYEG